MTQNDPRVVVALDVADLSSARALAHCLSPEACRLKVGKELFTAEGPRCIEALQADGFEIFLDLKFHDIPRTVAAAVRAAADLGVWMVNVHALGGPAMLAAAVEGRGRATDRPWLTAVTVLTSHNADEVAALGFARTPDALVRHLAALAREQGVDGLVCSAREAAMLRQQFGTDWLLVTPGIRPADASPDDQARIMTPGDAMRAGASYLVVGRPITGSDDPAGVLRKINAEIAHSLNQD